MAIAKQQGYSQSDKLPMENLSSSFHGNDLQNSELTTQQDNSQADSSQVCIHQLFATQAHKTPDAIAVISTTETITYAELNTRSNQLAHYLRTLGVKPEVLVGICVERSIAMIVGILGILKAGGAYVPIDPNLPSDRIDFILEDSQTPFLLTQASLIPSKLAPQLSHPTCKLICIDGENADQQSAKISDFDRTDPDCSTTLENLMYVIYTSGSTGKPKGVMVPHRGILNQLYWRQNTFGLTSCDRVLQNIPFSFDPSVWQIFWPLCFGGQLILPDSEAHKDSSYLVELIHTQKITITAFVPSMLRVLLDEPGIEKCTCLRHISCGGEALSTELVNKFFQRLPLPGVLHNVYGPTEASIDASFWCCLPDSNQAIAPIGQAINGAQIYLLDENLQPVPPSEVGELHIAGKGLARGYLQRSQLTSEKFIPNPFPNSSPYLYKTGDLARLLPDGNLEFLGRIDHQVKIRGFRIELGEIEATLLQLPQIREAVVVARQDGETEKRLVAYIVPTASIPPNLSTIRQHLQQNLAEYMVPSAIMVLDALPLNANGKIDRQALPNCDRNRSHIAREYIPPSTNTEIKLANIWKELLEIDEIGIRDNFFELGGTSLIATRVLLQIQQQWHRKLPLSAFLQSATIAQLAAILEQKEEDNIELWSSLVPIQPQGEKPPLFCIHAADGSILPYQNLVPYLGYERPIYGIQPQGLDGKQDYLDKIEDFATSYVQLIRNQQPQGPYYLAGYSAGGVIAFEMAQQLLSQGQEVAFLTFFDTICPKYYAQKVSTGNWFSYHLRNIITMKFSHKLIYLQGGLQERWRKFVNLFQPPEPTAHPNDPDCEIFPILVQAVRNYRPQKYPGKIILFRCVEQTWWINHDRELGWAELTSQPIDTIEAPGSHDCLPRENAGFLGMHLQKYLG